jgi:prefoldin subunit 5
MRSTPNRASTATQLQLGETESSARLLALLRERDRLQQQASRKRTTLENLRAKLERLQVAIGTQVAPLAAQLQAIDAEIHAVFREVLNLKRLDRRGRAKVRELYEFLQEDGVISEASDLTSSAIPFDEGELEDGPAPFATSASGETVAGATKVDAGASLKSLFRKLTVAIHPDRAEGEVDRVRRTDAMKEVSRAYEGGDVARLIELERAWLAGEAIRADADVDELARRCADVERLIAELRAQMKRIDREARDLRTSPAGVMSRRMGLGKKAELDGPVAEMAAEGQEGVKQLTVLRDFVASFRDGKISLKELLAGPAGAEADDDADDEFEKAVLAAMEELLGGVPQPPRRRRKRR